MNLEMFVLTFLAPLFVGVVILLIQQVIKANSLKNDLNTRTREFNELQTRLTQNTDGLQEALRTARAYYDKHIKRAEEQIAEGKAEAHNAELRVARAVVEKLDGVLANMRGVEGRTKEAEEALARIQHLERKRQRREDNLKESNAGS